MLRFINKLKEKVKIELEKMGILQPKIEIKVPKELVKFVAYSTDPARRKKKTEEERVKELIERVKRSKWITDWCKSRVLPPEHVALTEEELKSIYPEEYKVFDMCREMMAREIIEKYKQT